MAAAAGALQSRQQQYGLLASAQETIISNKFLCVVRWQEFIEPTEHQSASQKRSVSWRYPMFIDSISDNIRAVYYIQAHSHY